MSGADGGRRGCSPGSRAWAARRGATAQVAEVNGGPGLLAFEDGRLVAVWTFEFSGDAVQAIRGVVNPDKLAHISSTILPSLPPALKRS